MSVVITNFVPALGSVPTSQALSLTTTINIANYYANAAASSYSQIAGNISAVAANTATCSAAVATVNAAISNLGSIALLTGGTYSGKIITNAAGSASAGLGLPHGVAPTSPINGDIWTTSSGLFASINGTTRGPYIDTAGILLVRNPQAGSTYTLTASDTGKFVDLSNSGGLALTFPAASSLGTFVCAICNSGTGAVTISRSASDTIDGLTTYIMYPGEIRYVSGNGTNAYVTRVLSPFHAMFTASSGNFVVPPGYQLIEYYAVAGGGGAFTGGAPAAGGGGAGWRSISVPTDFAAIGSNCSIIVGAAGANSATTAQAGGSTIVGTLVQVNGGAAAASSAPGNGGGVNGASANDVSIMGVNGASASSVNGGGGGGTPAQPGGNSVFGGAGGGGTSAAPGKTAYAGNWGRGGSVTGNIAPVAGVVRLWGIP